MLTVHTYLLSSAYATPRVAVTYGETTGIDIFEWKIGRGERKADDICPPCGLVVVDLGRHGGVLDVGVGGMWGAG